VVETGESVEGPFSSCGPVKELHFRVPMAAFTTCGWVGDSENEPRVLTSGPR
jgi:hypothetical protein